MWTVALLLMWTAALLLMWTLALLLIWTLALLLMCPSTPSAVGRVRLTPCPCVPACRSSPACFFVCCFLHRRRWPILLNTLPMTLACRMLLGQHRRRQPTTGPPFPGLSPRAPSPGRLSPKALTCCFLTTLLSCRVVL
ncbi:hypothetical protein COO60DRAFT_1562555, partial [Scenedesmus sp. NREL 46B-D3]